MQFEILKIIIVDYKLYIDNSDGDGDVKDDV